MQKKRILYWITVVFLSLVIVVCGVLIAQKLINDYRDAQEYEQMASIMESIRADAATATTESTESTEPTAPSTDPTVTEDTTATEPSTEPTEPAVFLEYQMWHAINSDMVGWIKIDGTTISYPVVQSPYEANFYLRRNFYKEDATCGTIYAREACDVNEPSDNVTLYGHKMRNGTMFADLHEFKDKSFWEEYKYIQFDTLTERRTYEIFAVFQISAGAEEPFRYHIFDDAEDAEDFDEFVANCKSRAYYDTGITPEYGDKLLTLSTCDKAIDDGRLVVVARLVE